MNTLLHALKSQNIQGMIGHLDHAQQDIPETPTLHPVGVPLIGSGDL